MAEMNSSAGNLRSGHRTTKTITPRVDMTPMVDLMFLLITFFMLTTSLTKPVAMSLALPIEGGENLPIPDNRSITLCLGKNNEIQWYFGNEEKPLSTPQKATFASNSIRKLLIDKEAEAIKLSGSATKGLIVNIKPSDKSNYKNLVDILDELKITGIDNYFIVDISSHDLQRMKQSHIY